MALDIVCVYIFIRSVKNLFPGGLRRWCQQDIIFLQKSDRNAGNSYLIAPTLDVTDEAGPRFHFSHSMKYLNEK